MDSLTTPEQAAVISAALLKRYNIKECSEKIELPSFSGGQSVDLFSFHFLETELKFYEYDCRIEMCEGNRVFISKKVGIGRKTISFVLNPICSYQNGTNYFLTCDNLLTEYGDLKGFDLVLVKIPKS